MEGFVPPVITLLKLNPISKKKTDRIYKDESDGEDLSYLSDSIIGSKLKDRIYVSRMINNIVPHIIHTAKRYRYNQRQSYGIILYHIKPLVQMLSVPMVLSVPFGVLTRQQETVYVDRQSDGRTVY